MMSRPANPEPVFASPRPRRSLRVGRLVAWGLCSVLFVLLALVFVGGVRRPADPMCAGRRLSAWLADLVSPDGLARGAATNAIRRIGTNAVPALTAQLATPDPVLGRSATDARNYLPRGLWVFAMRLAQPRAGLERRWQAAAGLAALGAEAAPAVPALARAVHDPDPRVSAAAIEALRGVRPAGLIAMVGALSTTNATLFAQLCSAIGRCGPDAALVATQLVAVLPDAPPIWRPHLHAALTAAGASAVGPLARLLGNDQAALGDAAAAALRAMMVEDYPTVKAVIALLQSSDLALRRGAARVLAGRTFWERRTMAALAGALADPEPAVRLEAIAALRAASEWSDQATNALPAIQARLAAATGAEREALTAAKVALESEVRPR